MLLHFALLYSLIQPPLQSLPLFKPIFTSLLPHKTIRTVPTNNSLLYTSAIFASLYLHTAIPTFPTKNPTLTAVIQPIQAVSWPNEQVSLVLADTVLISPCFPEAWTGIAVLTITDFLLFRIKKSVYCRLQSLIKMLAIRMTDHPLHALPHPQSSIIALMPK